MEPGVIKKEGQRTMIEPVYLKPKLQSAMEVSVAAAFGRRTCAQWIYCGTRIVKLRWMESDGNGGLMPK